MRGLREFIRVLEKNDEIITVENSISSRFEVSAFVRLMLDRGVNKAFLFKNIQGYDSPVVANVLGSKKRLALAFGVPVEDLRSFFAERHKKAIDPEIVEDSPAKEVKAIGDVNILEHMPVLTHHEMDAGPYLTCSIVISKDPETGERGVGLHRVQVKSPNRLGVFLATPPLSLFLAKAEKMGKPLPVAIVNGVDPLTLFSSVIWAPKGVDKFAVAGGLKGEPIQLVKCETLDLEVPASSEFILEGVIKPGVREPEGPFGESTGYYLTFNNPVVEVKALTRRERPLYQALIPFTTEEETLLSFSWEIDNLEKVREEFPSVVSVRFFHMGMFTVVQVKEESEKNAKDIIQYFLNHPFIKVVVVVDEDVDPSNLNEVIWAISTRSYFKRDAVVKEDMPGLMIDPSSRECKSSPELFNMLVTKAEKLGIDATKPPSEAEKFKRVDVPHDTKEKVKKMVDAVLSSGS